MEVAVLRIAARVRRGQALAPAEEVGAERLAVADVELAGAVALGTALWRGAGFWSGIALTALEEVGAIRDAVRGVELASAVIARTLLRHSARLRSRLALAPLEEVPTVGLAIGEVEAAVAVALLARLQRAALRFCRLALTALEEIGAVGVAVSGIEVTVAVVVVARPQRGSRGAARCRRGLALARGVLFLARRVPRRHVKGAAAAAGIARLRRAADFSGGNTGAPLHGVGAAVRLPVGCIEAALAAVEVARGRGEPAVRRPETRGRTARRKRLLVGGESWLLGGAAAAQSAGAGTGSGALKVGCLGRRELVAAEALVAAPDTKVPEVAAEGGAPRGRHVGKCLLRPRESMLRRRIDKAAVISPAVDAADGLRGAAVERHAGSPSGKVSSTDLSAVQITMLIVALIILVAQQVAFVLQTRGLRLLEVAASAFPGISKQLWAPKSKGLYVPAHHRKVPVVDACSSPAGRSATRKIRLVRLVAL
ncbi:hypothetical protein ACEPPN_014192 [Leptodophora sp. 'Broadleaf-Isolate-01']